MNDAHFYQITLAELQEGGSTEGETSYEATVAAQVS